jgi:hypothetical protein
MSGNGKQKKPYSSPNLTKLEPRTIRDDQEGRCGVRKLKVDGAAIPGLKVCAVKLTIDEERIGTGKNQYASQQEFRQDMFETLACGQERGIVHVVSMSDDEVVVQFTTLGMMVGDDEVGTR